MNKETPYILMVDDSILVSRRLRTLLQDTGIPWPLQQAHDYRQAMNMVAARTPAIVVLDINLPGKSGLDLLRDIRVEHPEVIVIMFTNKTDNYYDILTQHLGADYFLDKSNDFERLPGLLHRLISAGKYPGRQE